MWALVRSSSRSSPVARAPSSSRAGARARGRRPAPCPTRRDRRARPALGVGDERALRSLSSGRAAGRRRRASAPRLGGRPPCRPARAGRAAGPQLSSCAVRVADAPAPGARPLSVSPSAPTGGCPGDPRARSGAARRAARGRCRARSRGGKKLRDTRRAAHADRLVGCDLRRADPIAVGRAPRGGGACWPRPRPRPLPAAGRGRPWEVETACGDRPGRPAPPAQLDGRAPRPYADAGSLLRPAADPALALDRLCSEFQEARSEV